MAWDEGVSHTQIFYAGVKTFDTQASDLTRHPMESTKKMVQSVPGIASTF